MTRPRRSCEELRQQCAGETRARLKAEAQLSQEILRAETAERDLRNMTVEMRRLRERCNRAEAEAASFRRESA